MVNLFEQLQAKKKEHEAQGFKQNIADTLGELKPGAVSEHKETDAKPVGTNASLVDSILQSPGTSTNIPIPGTEVVKPKFKFGQGKGVATPAAQAIEKPVSAPVIPKPSPPPVKVADILNIEINTFEKGSSGYSPEELAGFQGAIKMLYDSIDQPQMVGQAIKNVMFSLAETPEFKAMLKPEDIGTMVRGLRASYGNVVYKKEVRKDSIEKGKSKQKAVDDAFADMEF